MNQEHYLNFAVWNKNVHGQIEPTLIKAEKGYFASQAWMISDEAYNDIAGRKFGAIFGDDATYSWVDKSSVRRLTSDEEFEQLYEKSCLSFKVMLKVLGILEEMKHRMVEAQDINEAHQLSWKIPEFKYGGAGLLKGMNISEMPSEDELKSIATYVARLEWGSLETTLETTDEQNVKSGIVCGAHLFE